MKSYFAVALLASAVVGRGENNGNGGENALTYSMDIGLDAGWSMNLHLYNAFANDINEFHGDVELSFAEDPAISQFNEFGFCLNRVDTDIWDCLKARATLSESNSNDIIQKSVFKLFDVNTTDLGSS